MKIQAILTEKELNEAIMAYVVAQGYPVSGMDVSIELTKGRKGNGTYATIDFSPAGSKPEVVVEEAEEVEVEVAPVVEEEVPFDVEPEPIKEVTEEEVKEEEVVSPKKSLFG